MPKNIKTLNNFIDIDKQVNNLSSFNKELNKKRNFQKTIPNMFCDADLVDKFRNLAKQQQWTNTTLMNNILRDYFDRLENGNNEND
ncbi:hypothetical protein [Spiroplasma endosymbiont of Megaselia nigra]|uniref:hypothetical protein n=1 Tax=Spiroplasma endosymbiont of Megaselia nigra TaxID=2478537 RepID=UPI000F878D9F|nr:hypothetical protein [Spiroplasma endosymbiont of Megaselia nigra]RUO85983.1 hypothetical protein D9R21_05685 [Spiroplasma endosymbiont of Megaselia nigra]